MRATIAVLQVIWLLSLSGHRLEAISAEAFLPDRPVRILAANPGGGNDFAVRLVADGLNKRWTQRAIVENRGAASGAIAASIVAKAPADGYTLLFYGSPIWLAPFLRNNVPYDPVKDFAPITLAVTSPNILVVHPSVPAKSVSEFIALAKAKPGTLNYASLNIGGSPHLSGELFKSVTGINVVNVPYKGNGPALSDLMSGRVQMMFGTAGSVTAHIKSGKIRPLAITSMNPSSLFPDLPTVASAGFPNFEASTVFGMLGPAKLPARLIQALNEQIVSVLRQEEVKAKLNATGVESVGSTAEEFKAFIADDMKRMGKVIRDANIRAE